ncbi:translocase [Cognatishimia sp. F0-27]|nr:translocase [Cognatishimia sp. F0-27]
MPPKGKTGAGFHSTALAALTVSVALGTGYVMQFGFSLPGSGSDLRGPIEVTDIRLTSSSVIVPRFAPDAAPEAVVTPAALVDEGGAETLVPEPEAPAQAKDCRVTMQADTTAGALVNLRIAAPCHGGDRVTLHHQGVRITETMDAEGRLRTTFPALAETAFFMASFPDGTGATAVTDVPALPFYDRAVLQWTGDAGIGLHAREFGTAYFDAGHVWSGQTRNVTDAATGEAGFMIALGDPSAPEALRAEVYSFPTGTARRSGDVLLTVETEVTEANCNRSIEAQIMQLRTGADVRARDLTLDIPACGGTGDFLVLKNVVEDLTIAAN